MSTVVAWPAEDAAYGIGQAAPARPAMPLPEWVRLHYDEIRAGIADYQTRRASKTKPQVSEFLLHPSDSLPEKQQELSYLRERAGRQPRRRRVLASREERAAKLSIETTRTHPVTGEILPLPPLEPWTCPVPSGLMAYSEIMFAEDGTFRLSDFDGERLTALAWMREQELVSVGDDGRIHALSDAEPPDRRAYPGAPGSDRKAAIGRYLRQHAAPLVLAAIVNLSAGKSVRRSRQPKASLDRGDGVSITAYAVCREANAIKAKRRRDLDEYRYLSVSAVRALIRALVLAEVLHEVSPPHPVRRNRSWRMLPRIVERLDAALFEFKPRPALEAA